MIWTKYNLIFDSDKFGKLLYNSLSNSFLNIGEDVFHEIMKIKKEPNNYEFNNNNKLKYLLLNFGVIYEGNELDIVNMLKVKSSLNKYDTNHMNLTIIPTLDCNFKCIYCYEEGNLSNSIMNNETINNLLLFIEKKAKKKINITIHWFGGEPLLQYDIIKKISKKLNSFEINFSSGMTSNGYLLSKDVIRSFKELRIDDIQITIDGDREIHNKRRPHKINDDSFDTIISNLDFLVKYTSKKHKKFRINIRINVDNENKEHFNKTFTFLTNRYKNYKNISIYPGIVKGESSISNQNPISCSFNRKDENAFFVDQYTTYNNSKLNFYPKWFGVANCTATRINDFVVGPKGELYNCWHDVGDNNSIIGNINEYQIINDVITYNRFVEGINIFEDDKCKNCFFLPICGGGCPYYRVLNKYNGKRIDLCTFHKNKDFTKLLEIHYENKINIKKSSLENIKL